MTDRQPATATLHDGSSATPELGRLNARRRLILFAGIGIAFYLIAMVATMPASVFLKNRPWRTGVSGTIWSGEVGVAGGTTVRWSWAPLRSLTSLGLAVDWRATGADTDLGGRALLRPGRIVIDKASGRTDMTLIAAAWPDLGFDCQLVMQVDLDRLAVGGGGQGMEGRIVTDPGSCATAPAGPGRASTGAPVAVPALRLTAEKIGTQSQIRLSPQTRPRQTLVDAELGEDGGLSVTMTPAGAATLPFTGIPGGASIQGRL